MIKTSNFKGSASHNMYELHYTRSIINYSTLIIIDLFYAE